MSAPKPGGGDVALTEETVAELRRLLAEATPGPWIGSPAESWAGPNAVLDSDGHPIAVCGDDAPWNGYLKASADRALIVAAVNALRQAVAR